MQRIDQLQKPSAEAHTYHAWIQALKHVLNDTSKSEFVLHTPLGEKVLKHLRTSRELGYAILIDDEGRSYMFHQDLLPTFILEVRPRVDSATTERRGKVGFVPPGKDEESVDL